MSTLRENWIYDGAAYTEVGGTDWRAQSFLCGYATPWQAYQVTSIQLRGYAYQSSGDFTVGIYSSVSGKPGSLLISKTVSKSSLPSGSSNWFEITFDDPYLLTLNSVYHIVSSASSGTVRLQDQNGYSGGSFAYSSDGGSSWTVSGTIDMVFAVWGIEPFSSSSSSSSSSFSSSSSSSSSSLSSSSSSSSLSSSSSSLSSSSSSSFSVDFPVLTRASARGFPAEFVIDPGVVTAALGIGRPRVRREFQDAFRGWRDQRTNCSAADYAAFEIFYRETVQRSVRPFRWRNPRTRERVVVRFWFREPPRWQRVAEHQVEWTVDFTLAECAGATGVGYGGADA